MAAVERRPLEVASRRVVQDAKLAIRDVYDAIVELVTNADDRYQILGTNGRVEIELGRQGKGRPSILRVRDFADGMTTGQMNRKLGRIGGRVGGLEEGFAVRGTNSRGAKDIAALGKVTFESIAGDDRVHTCRIFPNLEYEADDARQVTPEVRKRLQGPRENKMRCAGGRIAGTTAMRGCQRASLGAMRARGEQFHRAGRTRLRRGAG